MITYLYFNSIKVRLEQCFSPLILKDSQFQFHKGAIRTVKAVTDKIFYEAFQFHKGAIRTFQVLLLLIRHFHFNSIKVRLERLCEEHHGYTLPISIP